MPERVCIVGVGLIGGSLGLGLRRKRFHVTGLGRDNATLGLAKRMGAVDDFSTNAAKAVGNADIVVVCVPVHKIVPVIRQILPHLKKGAVVTDVGSVKKGIVDGARKVLRKRRDVFFVGAHPIAGSEKAGVKFAQKDLFRGATCVVTSDGASFGALSKVKAIWSSVGGKCLLMNAADHDRWLAMTSHLPHLLSFALFSQVSAHSSKNPLLHKLVGGSFRDMTRIAGADPDLWTGIITENRAQIKNAVNGFLRELGVYSRTPAGALRGRLAVLARAKTNWR